MFIATAQAFDDEMRARIARHRRGARGRGLRHRGGAAGPGRRRWARVPPGAVVLVDCLTLWLSNLLLADRSEAEYCCARRRPGGGAPARAGGATLLVSNEVGMGLVPETPLGRRFRDMTASPTSGWRRWRPRLCGGDGRCAAVVPGTAADVPGGARHRDQEWSVSESVTETRARASKRPSRASRHPDAAIAAEVQRALDAQDQTPRQPGPPGGAGGAGGRHPRRCSAPAMPVKTSW